MGCGGKISSPGQPGTTPILPSVPISQAEPSATTMSAVPCVHRIGGLGSKLTIPAQLQYLPERAFRTPRVPGATPGQLGDEVESPGLPSSPVTDFRISSTSMSSRSFGSCCVLVQSEPFMTLRCEKGESAAASCSAIRLTNSGLPV